MLIGDFHIHTTFSDGSMTPLEVVDLFGRAGVGAIAITDHLCEKATLIGKTAHLLGRTLTEASFPLYVETLRDLKEYAMKKYRMNLIIGFEITQNFLNHHRSSHILALGVENYISPNGDALDIIRKIKAQGGVAVAAHPVSTGNMEKQTLHLWSRREELATEFDAWEVASGPHLFKEVLKSRLPMLANSDTHRPSQVNSWKTVLDCERHEGAILDAIRNQQVRFQFFDCSSAILGARRPSFIKML